MRLGYISAVIVQAPPEHAYALPTQHPKTELGISDIGLAPGGLGSAIMQSAEPSLHRGDVRLVVERIDRGRRAQPVCADTEHERCRIGAHVRPITKKVAGVRCRAGGW